MRILLVNYRYFISGGPEKYMFNIKRLLESKGHEVIPFSTRSNKNDETEYNKYFVDSIDNNNAVYYKDYKKTPRTILQLLSRSIYSFPVKRAIQNVIRETKPDIVYIIHFINKLSPSVIRGAKQMHIPVVLRLSDYFLLCPRFDFLNNQQLCEECLTHGYRSCIRKRCVQGSLFASIVRVLAMKIHRWMHVYRDVDAFITPSQFLRSKLIANGYPEDLIHCIPTFTANQTAIGTPQVGTYGLYFGRISVEKGVETVVRAYEKLPDYQVVIMGDDTTDEAIRLKRYVQEKKLDNITFAGHKSGEELEEVIKNARFTLIPSIWYDNLPNTALESFQFSKPVIASDIGSLPELVNDGFNGYLFAPGNADALAEKIRCLDDEAVVREMGDHSVQRLKDCFYAETHYDSLMSVFQKAINL